MKTDPFVREIQIFKQFVESRQPISLGRLFSRVQAAEYVIDTKTKKWREIYFDQFLEFLQHSGYLGILGERWLIHQWSKEPNFTELFCQLLKELYPLWKTHKKSEAGKKSQRSKKSACKEQPPQVFPIDLTPYLPRAKSSRLRIFRQPPDS